MWGCKTLLFPARLPVVFVYFVFVHWVCVCVCVCVWLNGTAGGTSALQLGIELVPPALEAQNLNHWSIREVPCLAF